MKSKTFILIILILSLVTLLCNCSYNENVEASDSSLNGLGIATSSFQEFNGWIYYVNLNTLQLWKSTLDGEEKIQIGEDTINFFCIYEEQIFYTTGRQWLLCRMDLNGSNRQVYDVSNPKVNVRKMYIANGWIYALTLREQLYKVKTDFSEYVELDVHPNDFSIDGEWIYFTQLQSQDNYLGYQLSRINNDGTEKQQIMYELGRAIDYVDNKIYFIDESSNICFTSDSGKNKQKILELEYGGTFLKVIDDWIYYENRDEEGIYKIKIDGSENLKITNNYDYLYFDIWDNWLLCVDYEYVDVIKIRDTKNTDILIHDLLSDWHNVNIYE